MRRAVAQPSDTDYLQYIYLKYESQPIDTQPAFDPKVVKYEATMDWKMTFFSVQANPVPPAVIENIHLCRKDADCAKEDQSIVVVDFSRNILVSPGGRVRFRFDVIREGEVKTYTIVIRRLTGSETGLRGLTAQGLTIWPAAAGAASTPGFALEVRDYMCLMDTSVELALVELRMEDAGQTVFASAEDPVPLGKRNKFSALTNKHPGILKAPPIRLRRLGAQRLQDADAVSSDGMPLELDEAMNWSVASDGDEEEEAAVVGEGTRRLRWHVVPKATGAAVPMPMLFPSGSWPRRMSEAQAGEFQYPSAYMQFPVPLGNRRLANFKVVSADGGHSGHYSLELARSSCPASAPLFDVAASGCVRFCNQGYFGDFDAQRCKRCHDSCLTCLSPHTCSRCPRPTRRLAFVLDNSTGLCEGMPRSLWQQHPQKFVALLSASISLIIFVCGLCAFRVHYGGDGVEYRRPPPAPHPAAPGGRGEGRAPRIGVPTLGGQGAGSSSGGWWGGSGGGRGAGASSGKYMRVSMNDDDFG